VTIVKVRTLLMCKSEEDRWLQIPEIAKRKMNLWESHGRVWS